LQPRANLAPRVCAAVAVVAVVFIVVQYGSSSETTLWLINQGRKYVEAPRWAAVGVVVVMLVFAYNVIETAYAARRITGITAVLMIDLVPIILLYLIAFPAISNMSAAVGTDGVRGFRCGARSALHAAFYASLGDEQKAQFNNVGQQGNTRSENTPGNR
jgi:hypothetical protein